MNLVEFSEQQQQQRFDSTVFRSILTNELKSLIELFKRNGHEIRIAGGAVRDLLMDIKPTDIDFATTATPDQMKAMFERAQIRMINNNGEKHGTITVRLDDKENYEITTLRIDVATDGRRAEVQFTNDWRLDANRRDLTVNSIFLDVDGTIVDFFGGYADLRNHRIRFVGEPAVRIQEDYLRILRYFRFYSRICLDANSHDQASLAAIADNAHGLAGIAGERIWTEFRKIVVARYADSLLPLMAQVNVLKYLGFPAECDFEDFKRVYRLYEHDLSQMPKPVTMVCILLKSLEQFKVVDKRKRLTNEENKIAEFFFVYRARRGELEAMTDDERLLTFKHVLVDNVKEANKMHEKIAEVLKYINAANLMPTLLAWPIPMFPVNGNMLATKNIPKGPAYTKVLHELKEAWKIEFKMDTREATVQELMQRCDKISY